MERHLPDSTMSRAIVINLRRKLPHETVLRLRHAEPGLFDDLASKLARFADDHAQHVRCARPELPEALSDRAQDNWEPLLAIAECAGPEWVRRATAAALKLSGDASEAVSTGNELLADIRQAFESKQVEKIRTTELIDALAADDEQGWATYNRGKPITPRQLARLLEGYGIRPKTVRFGPHTPKGYDRSQFADAFARYLPEVAQRRNDGPEASAGEVGGVADGGSVAATSTGDETPEPMTELGCGGVADPLGDDDGPPSRQRPPSIGPEELL
jgi:putative DNA primase/helicase